MSSAFAKVAIVAGALVAMGAGVFLISSERPVPCPDPVVVADTEPFLIAHRGAPDHLPSVTWVGFSMSSVFENTLPAYKRALVRGFDVVDGALRLTADDKVVFFEDEEISRATEGEGILRQITLEDLQALDAGDGAKVPSAKEVLSALPDGPRLHVRIPAGPEGYAIARLFGAEVHELGMASRLIVASEDREVLDEIRRKIPDVETAFIMKDPVDDAFWRGYKMDAFGCATTIELPEHHINFDMVKRAQKVGLRTIALGVETEEAWTKVRTYGVRAALTSFTAFPISRDEQKAGEDPALEKENDGIPSPEKEVP